MDVLQVPAFLGAFLVLAAYFGNQLGRLSARRMPYILLNISGAFLLAWVAFDSRQYGFLLLEGAWVLISLYALLRLLEK